MIYEEQRRGPSKRTVAILLVGLLIVGLTAATAYYYFVVLKERSSAAGEPKSSVEELADKIAESAPPLGFPAGAFKNVVGRSFKIAWNRPSIDESRYLPTKYQIEFLDQDGAVVADKIISGENQNTFAFDLVGIPNLQENQTYWWRVKCLYLDKPTFQFIGGGFTLNDVEEPPFPVGSGFTPRGEIKYEALPKYLTFDWDPALDPDPGDSVKSYDILIKKADGEILQKSKAEPPFQIASNLIAIEDSVISFRVRSVDSEGQKSAWSPEQITYIRPKIISPPAANVREAGEALPPSAVESGQADLGSFKERLIPAIRLPEGHVRIEDQILFYFKKDPADASASLRNLVGREIQPSYVFEILNGQEFPPKTRLLSKDLNSLVPLRLSTVDKIQNLPADVYFARLGIRVFQSDEVTYGDPVELSFLGSVRMEFPRPKATATPRDVFRWQEYIGPSPDYKTPDIYVVKVGDSPDLLDEVDPVADRLFVIETSVASLDFYKSVAAPFKKTSLYEKGDTKLWYARIEISIYGATVKSDVVEFYFGQKGY